jgi:hypothetical protein
MHISEWASMELLKAKDLWKACIEFVLKIWIFRVQHLDYCSLCLFVASPNCWYCSGSHISHKQSSKSIQKSNSLKICSLDSGRAESPGLARKLRVSQIFRTWPGDSGLLRYKCLWPRWKSFLSLFHSFTAPPSLPHRPFPSWAISTSNRPNRVKVRVWRLQGVEIKDLLKTQRIQAFFPLSPRYIQRSFSRSTSLA